MAEVCHRSLLTNSFLFDFEDFLNRRDSYLHPRYFNEELRRLVNLLKIISRSSLYKVSLIGYKISGSYKEILARFKWAPIIRIYRTNFEQILRFIIRNAARLDSAKLETFTFSNMPQISQSQILKDRKSSIVQ